jgi:hypothetical protein
MFFLVCVPNAIKIGQKTANLQHFIYFQDGGGGHLGKWLLKLHQNWVINAGLLDLIGVGSPGMLK